MYKSAAELEWVQTRILVPCCLSNIIIDWAIVKVLPVPYKIEREFTSEIHLEFYQKQIHLGLNDNKVCQGTYQLISQREMELR